MIHPDGIEVYLKPAGKDNEGLKCAEFPVSDDGSATATDDGHGTQSIILARDEGFVVVVRCQPSFKMYSASALLVEIYDGFPPPRGSRMARRTVIQRSFAHEQNTFSKTSYFVVKDGKKDYSRSNLRMRNASEALRGSFDNAATAEQSHRRRTAPGSVRVTVTRGTAQWKDSLDKPSRSPYGAGNPAQARPRQHGTSKYLASQNGQRYTFEFKYRSEACIRQLVPTERTDGDAQVDTEALAIIDDSEFLRNRKLDEAEREKMNAAWLKREAELAQNANSETRSGDDPPESNEASKQAAVAADGQKLPSRSKQPPARAPEAGGLSKSPSRAQKSRSASSDSEDDSSPLAVNPEELEGLSNETPRLLRAAVCSKCKGVKIARDRRPDFLRQWYDSKGDSANPGAEEDDDESLPNAKVESAADTAEGDEQNVMHVPQPSPVTRTPSEKGIPGQATPAEGTEDTGAGTPDAPVEVAGVAGGNASIGTTAIGLEGPRKRAATVDLKSTKTKQPRIDVDLTGDNDDDVVEIKRERAARAVVLSSSIGGTGEDEEALHEQLREIELEEKRLQLQEKKMKVEAKLRVLQHKKAVKAPFKAEGVIKVED